MPSEWARNKSDGLLSRQRPRVCLIAATPLTLQFFFRDHVASLHRWADVTLIFNHSLDKLVQPLDLPADSIDVPIQRNINPMSDLLCLVRLYRTLWTGKYDLVITLVPKAGLLGSLAGWLAGVRVRVHIFQGEVWASRRGLLRKILKTCDRITALFSTDLIAVSRSERDFLAIEKVANEDSVFVPMNGSIAGVNTDRFQHSPESRARIRERHQVKPDDILFLFLGRVVKDKGVRELLVAFAIVALADPNIRLAVIGPDEEGVLEELMAPLDPEISGRILVEGYSRTPEEWMSASDILVLPSYREGFGVVALEAAAVGLPVIGSNVYGLTDAVADGSTGVLIPPRDSQKLANAMMDLSSDKDLRTTLGTAGKERAKRDFRSADVIAAYDDQFKRLLRNQRAEVTIGHG